MCPSQSVHGGSYLNHLWHKKKEKKKEYTEMNGLKQRPNPKA